MYEGVLPGCVRQRHQIQFPSESTKSSAVTAGRLRPALEAHPTLPEGPPAGGARGGGDFGVPKVNPRAGCVLAPAAPCWGWFLSKDGFGVREIQNWNCLVSMQQGHLEVIKKRGGSPFWGSLEGTHPFKPWSSTAERTQTHPTKTPTHPRFPPTCLQAGSPRESPPGRG